MELERRLAAFKNVEAVVVFQSGFAANAGTVSAILTKDDVDHLRRAQSREHHRRLPPEPRDDQGVSAQGRRRRAHDPEGAARRPAQAADHRRRVLDGRRSRPAARALRRRRRVRRDHDGGRRACERRVWAARGAAPSIISTVTAASTSRSARCRRPSACSAATSPARKAFIEFLYHRARPFLFSTSHPPAVAAACIAAIDVLEQEPQWMEQLWDNTRFFKAGLQALGFNTGRSESPITPVIVGEARQAMEMSDRLFERGVFAQGIGFPTVARDQARLADDRRRPPTRARTCSTRSTCSGKSGRNWASSEIRQFSQQFGDRTGLMTSSVVPAPFFETYTKDFTTEELGKLFTYETPEAYRFFARGINTAELEGLPWHRRAVKYVQAFFLAFTMRLSPARRIIYGAGARASRSSASCSCSRRRRDLVPAAVSAHLRPASACPAPIFSAGHDARCSSASC